jgi:cytochrome c oxidase cbb3-type subunit I/II
MWHVRHMKDPREVVDLSIMPAYPHMYEDDIQYDVIQPRVDAMAMLGVPYGEAVNKAEDMARAQAEQIRQEILAEGGPDLKDKDIIALIAYLQRLGTDIFKAPPEGDGATEAPTAKR